MIKSFNTAQILFKNTLWKFTGNSSNIEKDYDKISKTYDDYYGNHLGTVTDHFATELDLANSKNVIELACGTGHLTSLLKKILPTDGCLSVSDISEKMLAINIEKNSAPAINFYQQDAIKYLNSVQSSSVNAIICAWGVCYLDHDQLREQVQRVLKSDGIFSIIENRRDTLRSIIKIYENVIISHPFMLKKQ